MTNCKGKLTALKIKIALATSLDDRGNSLPFVDVSLFKFELVLNDLGVCFSFVEDGSIVYSFLKSIEILPEEGVNLVA